jgi:dTDP-4-amino-4,6-dideoxygalactose transaminase
VFEGAFRNPVLVDSRSGDVQETIRFGTLDFGSAERQAVHDLVDCEEPMLSMGRNVREFEGKFAAWLGCKHAVMVNSGTSALETAVLAAKQVLGLSCLLTSPLSYCATWNAIINSGVRPRFKDVDDYVIHEVQNTPTLPVHLVGKFSDTAYPVIEDACESMGSTHNGKKHGRFGLLSCFSFYVAHVITTVEGGMIAVNDGEHAEELFDACKSFRDNGRLCICEPCGLKVKGKCGKRLGCDWERRWAWQFRGHNFKPTEFQGVLGLMKMRKIESIVDRRFQIFRRYNETFHSMDSGGDKVVSLGYPVKVADPSKVVTRLAELHIEARGMFIPYSAYYKKATEISRSHILLPLHQDLSDEDLEYIIECVGKVK